MIWCPRCQRHLVTSIQAGACCPVCTDQERREHDEKRQARGWAGRFGGRA